MIRSTRSRRRWLKIAGAGGLALLAPRLSRAAAGESGAACVVRPRHVEGPFFVDTELNRSDIRSDPKTGAVKAGVPLRITFRVSALDDGRCTPLHGARVDLWQCDADGLYSGVTDWQKSTVGHRFLRGYQLTDRRGHASFTTIYPGWYPNRAVHVHFKIRTPEAKPDRREFTSQLYFEDDLTDVVHAQPAYANHGPRSVRNNRDVLYLFRGSQLVLPVRDERKGYAGTFDIALEM